MAVPTTPVTAEHLTVANIAATAHCFQHWVPKQNEVRVTIVDSRIFAVRIDAGSPAARVDWRTDYEHLAYSVTEVPVRVRQSLLAMVKRFELRFAAADFIVTPDDTPNGERWVFSRPESQRTVGLVGRSDRPSHLLSIADYLQGPV